MKKQDTKTQYNPANEMAKYKYRIHLRRVNRRDEKTILAFLQHIREYEIFTDFIGFERYNGDVADRYIQWLTQRELTLSYIGDNVDA
jgi:hypothetical protein